MLDKSEKIFVAGHRGMVGSALIRRLEVGRFLKPAGSRQIETRSHR